MTFSSTSTSLSGPAEWPDNAAFWQAAREGRLRVRHCDACGKPHWYPRVLCPFCFGTTHWKDACGRGTVYSFSITRRAGPEPFCIAYVTLDEGVSMMTRIVGCDPDSVRIGQRVQVQFSPTENGALAPTFTPA